MHSVPLTTHKTLYGKQRMYSYHIDEEHEVQRKNNGIHASQHGRAGTGILVF